MQKNDIYKYIDQEIDAKDKRRKTEVYKIFGFDTFSSAYNLNASNLASVVNAYNLSGLASVLGIGTLALYVAVYNKHYLTKEINNLHNLKDQLKNYSIIFDNENDLKFYVSDEDYKYEEELIKEKEKELKTKRK